MAMHNVSLHRALAHMNHGGLHRALHVPENETIPTEKVEKATHSSNEHLAAMARMAQTMSHWKKK